MLEVASQTTIKAKKGDTACSIVMTLTENGKIYHIADGCRAVFSGKKSDGNYLFNGETCRIEDNTIIYDFTEQTVAIEGVVECEVILYKDNEQLTTPRFNILVGATVYNGEEIVSTPEADALKEFIEESENRVNSIVEESENVIEEVGEVHRNSNQHFANAIKGTASGTDECIITDVSPLEHNINVKVDNANAKVIRTGKNLYDQSKYVTGLNKSDKQIYTKTNSDGTVFTIKYLPDEDCLYIDGETKDANFSVNVPITPNIVGEGDLYYMPSVRGISGEADYMGSDYKKYANVMLFTRGSALSGDGTKWLEVSKMQTNQVVIPTKDSNYIPLPADKPYISHIRIYVTPGIDFKEFKFRIQLEKGTTATDYEKYASITEHTPNADGTVLVPSVYPTTVLTTDTKGVTIDAEYNKDTNKVVNDLIKAVISLGGNV